MIVFARSQAPAWERGVGSSIFQYRNIMKTIALLNNSIQEYEWGSFTAIPKLLGAKWPFDKPAAELWIGAHPKAPSKVYYNKKWISLLNLLEEYPEDILGKETASKFKNRLPFLFKVLAAEKPLSIQAHPDRTQAIEGFEKENQLKIALNAFNRNYRDENHKPELICALTPFEALNGFRPVNEIIANIEKVCPNSLKEEKEYLLSKPGETGVKAFFHSLLTMEYDRKKAVIESAIINISDSMKNEPCFKWMIKLYEQYPDDIGAFSPLILNLVVLNSGQAMFIASKQLHGYLNGVGIEVMANSDNVLRVGLTSKHIDTEELLKVLDFKERKI